MRIGVELTDTHETATLTLGDTLTVRAGLADPDFKVTLTSTIFDRILKREADAFALAGRARLDEVRPINFEFYRAERFQEAMEAIKTLGTLFFTPGKIKVKRLRPDLAGEAHGAHPIPLVYWKGVRFAWYRVKAGETLNKEGEKDPWPQLFLPLSGKGRAIISDEEFNLVPKTAIYVPRNCFHQIIAAKEAVELLWLAWDAE
jgi:mannose-6-phosphate isomerase-like protein (cupin superfamily)